MNELTLYFISLVTLLTNVRGDNVLGCGGFLKSHVPIDFSKVEVKLITKQGIVKDKTTAAPNNGYYFVPLYDKGEMLLELSPPPGWSFEPKNVALNIDGETDLCSQGKDINFIFKGFGITGKIDSLGSQATDAGPEGVTIKLESDDDIRTTISDKDGNFFFTPVYPKKYKVSITHPKWKIFKNSVEVVVTEGNTELPKNSLVIQGFDVSGQVKSEGESVKDTIVALLSPEKKSVPSIPNCSKEPLKGLNVKGNILCQVKTDEFGKFTFETLPNGQYYALLYYKTQNIYYKPEKIEFTVNNKDLELKEHFEIIGFSIAGKVLKQKGVPLKNAKVFLNEEEITETDSNGRYTLEKIKAGTYKLKAESENLQFDEISIPIDTSLPELPDIFPSAFKICGSVTSDRPQQINFVKVGSTKLLQTLSSAIDGTFCEYLSPGKYEVQVIVGSSDKEKGLQFYPLVQTIEVNSESLPNVVFSQLKSTISGKVMCLVPKDCEDLTVALKGGADNEFIVKVKSGSYSLSDMYPGTYEIRILSSKFCWESNVQNLIVDSEIVEAPPFIQKGYTVVFISSHNTQVTFKQPGQDKPTLFDIAKGRSNFCLQQSGDYLFTIQGCHSYHEQTVQYTTNADVNEIILTAKKHSLKLGIQADSDFGDVQVSVKIGTSKSEEVLRYMNNVYELEISLEPSENAVLVPQSDVLFFTPPILSVEGGDDCADLGAKFVAVKGQLFEGKVVPALAGVTVTVESADAEKLVMETDRNGAFKFPPLDGRKGYKISAVKESYVLTGPDQDGNFLAHKLAEVIVEVIDADNNPLAGVLLSLSGGDGYRKNLQSREDGKILFTSLSPSEYFLRPMMKEYQFEPASKIIPVKEGETVNVHLRAKRVAYSAYGQVMSLNGEPEVDMIIVAQGVGNCSEYSEETTCESSGHFRIRGLHPYCSYKVTVKDGQNDNVVVERSAPEFVEINSVTSDTTGLKLVVFRPATHMDILVKIHADNVEHYKSLKVKLTRELGSPAVLHTAKIDASSLKITNPINPGLLLHLPPVPVDGKPYSLQLESGLQAAKQQVHFFAADESFKYFEFEFRPKDGASEQRIKQTSPWSLVFIFAILVGAYNVELVANFLSDRFNFNASSLASLVSMPGAGAKPAPDYFDDAHIDQIVQSINNAKKKPKPKKLKI
ncbi:unnamed protein product [Phyllotreta striolata]|uniref:Uncharacterized protein n=1 Tax=Phyllotreta striolata TaxID=444603 RepID=A0A9N9XKE1_PHYSR|nr:unnamed protein product [Phyllotreta striolata]